MGNHHSSEVVLEDGGAHKEKRRRSLAERNRKVLKRFNTSLGWFLGRIVTRDVEMDISDRMIEWTNVKRTRYSKRRR